MDMHEVKTKHTSGSFIVNQFLKRAFDLVLAVIGSGLTFWLIAITYVLATLDTRKNGFFIQVRVGRNGKPFKIIKLRTMRDLPGFYSTVTTANDPRVTRLGRFFRRTKIDELPQFFNVLHGTMSIVGPRATVPEDYQKMNEHQRRRFDVKPGLTSVVHLKGGTSLPWSRRIAYDLEYIEHQNLWLDVKIVAQTLWLIFTGRIETHPQGDDEWAE